MFKRQSIYAMLCCMAFTVFTSVAHATIADKHPQNLQEATAATYQIVSSRDAGGGTGSGFLTDMSHLGFQGCYITTNAHVVYGANAKKVPVVNLKAVQFKSKNGREWQVSHDAEVVRVDTVHDVAILKIDECDGVKPFKLRLSSAPQGAKVYAIGSPLALTQSVTSGVVTYPLRSQSSNYTVYVQTDAAINSGNSGGPLVLQSTFEVIAVNTMVFGRYVTTPFRPMLVAESVGFSVLAGIVENAYRSHLKGVTPFVPKFGLSYRLMDADVQWLTGYPQSFVEQGCQGFSILNLKADSGFKLAGLQVGDVIVKVGDRCINSRRDLVLEVATSQVQNGLKVVAWRPVTRSLVTKTVTLENAYEPLLNERDDGQERQRVYGGLLGFEISNQTEYGESLPVVTKVYQYSSAYWQNVLLAYKGKSSTQFQLSVVDPCRDMKPYLARVLESPGPVIAQGCKRLKTYQYIKSVQDTSGRSLPIITQSTLEQFAKEAQARGERVVLNMRLVVLVNHLIVGGSWVEDDDLSFDRLVFLKPKAYKAPKF